MTAPTMEKVLVLQSDKPPPRPEWRRRCLTSVEDWAAAQGYAYRLIGDELFDPIPEDLRKACAGVLLPLTDIGRLLWLQKLLQEGWERAIWLDADILIFDASMRITGEAVGREIWISKGRETGFRAAESVNNCVLSVSAQSALRRRLLEATLAKAASFRAPPHPRALGPDLFRRLHAADPLPVVPDIAMTSPIMLAALANGDAAPLAAHRSVWAGPVRAANLCGSLVEDDEQAGRAVQRLLESPGAFSPAMVEPPVEWIRFA